ncbi:ferritin-like protein [Streptomyces sp. NPDC028722]|uniref:ferritin-like domain-containing protein n=1 Tax=unclassified Streptomyces TaxID=2593676 RepID=UPI0033D16E57
MTGTTEDAHGSAAGPFRRRSFLASAALVAAAQVPAADPVRAADPDPAGVPDPAGGPGQAGALPECGPPGGPGCRSVAGLLAVPEADRGVGWLRQALEAAVALELATLPPYLCAWWSVGDRRGEAARLIRRVIGDEMYHLGAVCNLLVAVGGRPRIRESAPTYPGPLPGGVRSGLKVYLSGLTRSFVHDVMMAIEAPDTPLARAADRSPSIGDFYGDLLKAFREAAPELSARGQLSSRIGSDELEPVRSLDDVERSIAIVKEQGEGTASSPADSVQDDHPAHYYAFAEIYHGRQLRRTDHGWHFTGAPVPFPDARPMARVPAGGWPHPPQRVRQLLDRFDRTYATVLDKLDAAWSGGGASAMGAAVHAMRAMEEPAVELMEITIPDAPGNYGPQFRLP